LVPLDENGDLLAEGAMRPYHLYTGRQFVHQDKRWTMQESRDLFDRYSAKLNPVDDVYRRVFRILRTYKLRLAATSRDLSDTLATKLSDATEALRNWSDAASLTRLEFGEDITERVNALVDQIRSVSQPLANARKDATDAIGNRVDELSDSLTLLTGSSSNRELALNISGRITELTELIDETVMVSTRGGTKK
jgi:phage-related protein